MSFPRYPKYRASGADWLGDVPDQWEVKPLRHISTIRKGRLPDQTFPIPTTETDLPYLSMEYLRGESESPAFVSSSSKSVLAGDGDILILWDGSNAGEFLRAKQGVVSSTVALVEPENIWRDFLFFACKALERRMKDQTVGMGIPHVSGEELRTCAIACPGPDEQKRIAEFLDRETGKIDELVAEQRRLMELLKEKRQAVISHAVTRGLNPAAPLKPSGIEWLGDVPKHWEIGKLNRLVSTRKGIAFKAEHFTDVGVSVVKASDIKGLTIRESETCLPNNFPVLFPQGILRTGEIVLSTVGSVPEVRNSAVGQIGKVPETLSGSLLNQNTVVFTPSASKLISDFLFLILQTVGYRDHLDLHAHGTANQASINVSDMLNFLIPLPSSAEQIKVTQFISEQLEKFNTLTAEAQRAIDLLQERRTALISAAVTGQIDVRPLLAKEAA